MDDLFDPQFYRIISFVNAIALMVKHMSDGFVRWAFVTDQLRHDRHGRTHMLNG
jgi:hypothetical protein